MRVLTAAQMQEVDRLTIEEVGIPSRVLMETAGRAVVQEIETHFEKELALSRLVVLCGRGNNGGDGFVIGRVLSQRGYDVAIYLIGRAAQLRADARANYEVLSRLEIPVTELASDEDWDLHAAEIVTANVVIDALFGTGLKEPLGGLPLKIVKALNESPNTVVAVDVPSGLSGDTHQAIGEAVKATLTVTLGAPKLPLVLPPGEGFCGELAVADIGIPQKLIDELDGPRVELLSAADLVPHLTPRDQDANKGDFGRILIVAGSPGKTGAAYLASMAALRSGAGLVTLATPRASQPILASMAPEYMTEPLDQEPNGSLGEASVAQVLALKKDVIAVGPGLGNGPWQQAFVFALLERSDVTLVLDADALNVCADDPHRLRAREGIDIIITPHPGEMARLTGLSIEEVQENRLEVARNFAMSHGVHVVLKGHRSLIAAPDGDVWINPTGNPGMATGGTGDVLTGVIAAWFGQLLDAEAACTVGVYLHGFAGDLAQRRMGESALIASDIIAHLGQATRDIFTPPIDLDDEDD
jgi:hydroxyethylthiazole kinase-like uncharacterized protein yjeF